MKEVVPSIEDIQIFKGDNIEEDEGRGDDNLFPDDEMKYDGIIEAFDE